MLQYYMKIENRSLKIQNLFPETERCCFPVFYVKHDKIQKNIVLAKRGFCKFH